MVTAIVRISQFDIEGGGGSLRQTPAALSNKGNVRNLQAGISSDFTQIHLPAISNPFPRPTAPGGWPTENEQDWSDSPTAQPLLLYRHRFGWGRDRKEIFPQPNRNLDAITLGNDGQRWGHLDGDSGLLMYEDIYARSDSGRIQEFAVKGVGRVLQTVLSFSNSLRSIRQLGEIEGETDLKQFPFLLLAVPEPFSEKNPVDSDVFIRLSNFATPLASGTITLYLDDVLQSELTIEEFFGGLGGFDVTWSNSFQFDYDAQVDVRWDFRDSDVPSNRFIIEYPFYTVKDLAGPRISNLVPGDETSNFPINGTIQFDVEDFENDVNIDSLVLYVNGVRVVDGVTGTLDLVRFDNEKGYTVKYTPDEPFLYGDLIPVAIFISDTSINNNETFFTYSFTTSESIAPRLINIRPLPCATDVPVGTDISVDIIDGGHGFEVDSIVFTVNEVERTGSLLIIPVVHRDD